MIPPVLESGILVMNLKNSFAPDFTFSHLENRKKNVKTA